LRAKGSKFRTPVTPLAVGIYLLLNLGVTIFLGGVRALEEGENNKGYKCGTNNRRWINCVSMILNPPKIRIAKLIT